jgi:elongator complex protein 3
VSETAKAFKLLRDFGFKIQVHYMPNLFGSNLAKDLSGYRKLFSDSRFRPDEVKIYPCSLIPGTKLQEYYINKLWKPYTMKALIKLVSSLILSTPRYTRVSRVIRDIPKEEIAAGNKHSNLREYAEAALAKGGKKIKEIRYREIRSEDVETFKTKIRTTKYKTAGSTEYFIEVVTYRDRIKAFLRLSLLENSICAEINRCAVIREVHVYGQSVPISLDLKAASQHKGLGKLLIDKACAISKARGFKRISVISAVGTRLYYQKLGFERGKLYQHKKLI